MLFGGWAKPQNSNRTVGMHLSLAPDLSQIANPSAPGGILELHSPLN